MKKIKIAGKIVGALAGLIAGTGLYGAILGVILGHILFDVQDKTATDFSESDIMNEQIYPGNVNILQSILFLCFQLVDLKKNVIISEIEIIREYFSKQFQFSHAEIKVIDTIIQNIFRNNHSLDYFDCISGINCYCTYKERIDVVQLLFLVAIVDKPADEFELKYIFDTAQRLKIASKDYFTLKKCFVEEIEDYYQVLGISADASNEEIKTAYRKLMIHLHPDKNNGQYDQKRFQQILNAYQEIKKEKKFS